MYRFILLCLSIALFFYDVYALSFDELQNVIITEICKAENNPNIKVELTQHRDLKDRNDLLYDSIDIQKSGKFIANVLLGRKKYSLHGSFYKYTAVPVVKERIIKGQMISENDIEVKDLAINSLPPSTIMESDNIIGMIAKKNLEINTPFKQSDIKKQTIIARGDLVTLEWIRHNLGIKTLATALSSGGVGDLIKVKTQNSNKVVAGEIIDSSTVKMKDNDQPQ